jgi:hypothetical protein
MNKSKLVIAAAIAAFASSTAIAADAVTETGRDVSKNAKKAGRDVQDATCNMVNGKMECAGKKAKHKIQNATDEVKDKADDHGVETKK